MNRSLEEKEALVNKAALAEIAKFANRNDMNLSANICMINSKSLNYIACTDMEGVPAGSWYSLMLKREDLEFKSSDGYYEFMNSIRHDDEGTERRSVHRRLLCAP